MYFVRTESYDTNAVNSSILTNLGFTLERQWNSFNHVTTPFAFYGREGLSSAAGNCCILFCSHHYSFLLSAVLPPEKVGRPCNVTPQASTKCCTIPEGEGGQNKKVKLNDREDLLCKFDVKVEGWDRTDAAFDRI